MKKLKLVLSTVIVFVLAFVFVACQPGDSTDPMVGVWESEAYSFENTEIIFSVELKEDGTFKYSEKFDGAKYSKNGEWTFENDVLTLKFNNKGLPADEAFPDITFEYKDDKLVSEDSFYFIIELEKK